MAKPSKKTKPNGEQIGKPVETESAVPEATGGAAGNPNFPDRPEATERKNKTLYLKLDPQGNPEWHRMTPASIEAWKSVFNHPATGSAFNTEPAIPEDRGAKPADASALLGWLAMGQAMFFSRATGLSLEETTRICLWTPDERESLEPRFARLMNKYGGEVIVKYGDEIFLVLTLSKAVTERYALCAMLANQRAAEFQAEIEAEKKLHETVQ